jgi:hypothetical protein
MIRNNDMERVIENDHIFTGTPLPVLNRAAVGVRICFRKNRLSIAYGKLWMVKEERVIPDHCPMCTTG